MISDVQDVTTGGAVAESIEWDQHQPVPGLEHLGRAVVDAQGQPSGSPANYEALNGAPHDRGWPAVRMETANAAQDVISELKRLFPAGE